MKRLVLILLMFIPSFVYAKEITIYERTYDDLRINESYNLDTLDYQTVMNTPSIDETQKVYDFADILTDSEEDNLYEFIKSYIEAYNSDYVIVTIDKNKSCDYSTSNCSLEYAENFYKYNYFQKEGVLVLIDLESKNNILYIYTSDNVSNIFNEKNINSIKEYSYKYLNESDYYDGLKDIIYTMSSYYKKDLSYYNDTKVTTIKDSNKYFLSFVIAFFVSLLTGLVVITLLYKQIKPQELIAENNYYLKNNGINKVNDILVSEKEVESNSDLFGDYNIKGDKL